MKYKRNLFTLAVLLLTLLLSLPAWAVQPEQGL